MTIDYSISSFNLPVIKHCFGVMPHVKNENTTEFILKVNMQISRPYSSQEAEKCPKFSFCQGQMAVKIAKLMQFSFEKS